MKIKLNILIAILSILTSQLAVAGSATWGLNPSSGDWNTAANWTPATVPNSPTDVATFDNSNTTGVSISTADTRVKGVVFNPVASAFTIALKGGSFTIGDGGITNNSGVTQTLATVQSPRGSVISMTGAARAGVNTAFVVGHATNVFFRDSSSADHATFTADSTQYYINDDATADHATFFNIAGSEPGGSLWIANRASAGSATIMNEGATNSDDSGGRTTFVSFATAASATITADGGSNGGPGGVISFQNDSTGAESTLIANSGAGDMTSGGSISFYQTSTGGSARVQIYGNAYIDVSEHDNSAPVTLGSLEGDGLVLTGSQSLTIGSNNLSTTFAGTFEEGDFATGGSLTKIGTGNLTLTGANTYTGGTTVSGGILLANNTNGSGTGSGPVLVAAGTFGGGGKVNGPVTVGTGSGPGAFLGPGTTGVIPGTLTVGKKLTLMADATFKVTMNSSSVTADKVTAKGVKIRGAQVLLDDRATSVLPSGTTFTVINNTAATPIAGTFANLPDGSTIVVGNNTFQANYEGGDGNDLTLTVTQ